MREIRQLDGLLWKGFRIEANGKQRYFYTDENTVMEMAEKIDANVAAQEAMAELTGAASEAEEDLRKKYSSPDVEDDLAELKETIGCVKKKKA